MTVSKKVKWEHSPTWVRGLYFFWPSMVIVFISMFLIGNFLWSGNFYKSILGLYFILMTILFILIWAVNISIFGLGWLMNNVISSKEKKKVAKKRSNKMKLKKKLKKAKDSGGVLNAGEDETAEVGEEIAFIASLEKDILYKKFRWDFGDGVKKKGRRVKHCYDEPGVYSVKASVSDKKDNWYHDEISVSVRDPDEPKAVAGDDKIVDVGDEVKFDGSGSKDSIGIVSYEWYFDDWTNGRGEKATHVYEKPGVYEVRLIITDEAGYFDQDTIKVIVEDPENKKPVAKAGGDKIVEIGQKVKFNGSKSTDDVGIKKYEWDFGDGMKEEGEIVKHIYIKPGRYKAKLIVTDLAGNRDETRINIRVEGDQQDFVDLMEEVKGIGNSTAKRLYENGYQDEKEVKNASIDELSDVSYVTKEKAERLKEYFTDK
ncbi:MAG: PKD domain-containing protein [Thermoplasmatota archaeon]